MKGTQTRPPMSKQKWRRRKVPRWLVRCAPHQAIGGLIRPDVFFGAGCPQDLISRRLSSAKQAAAVALFDMTAQRGRAAGFDGPHDPTLTAAQMADLGLTV